MSDQLSLRVLHQPAFAGERLAQARRALTDCAAQADAGKRAWGCTFVACGQQLPEKTIEQAWQTSLVVECSSATYFHSNPQCWRACARTMLPLRRSRPCR